MNFWTNAEFFFRRLFLMPKKKIRHQFGVYWKLSMPNKKIAGIYQNFNAFLMPTLKPFRKMCGFYWHRRLFDAYYEACKKNVRHQSHMTRPPKEIWCLIEAFKMPLTINTLGHAYYYLMMPNWSLNNAETEIQRSSSFFFFFEFGLRLQVQASGFELTTPILEAERSNH